MTARGIARGVGLSLVAALLVSPVATRFAAAAVQPAPVNSVALSLDVLLVNDPAFPPVTGQQARAIMHQAQITLVNKLGFSGLRYRIVGSTSVHAFLTHNLSSGDPCLARLAPFRVHLGQRATQIIPLAVVRQFLSRWSLEELRNFFAPPQRVMMTSYDAVARALLIEMDRKIARISTLRLDDGTPLLTRASVDDRSYVRWICAMRHQNNADLVLTNAFILYDLGSEPYPHSIFQKCKVGGASLPNRFRQAIFHRAVLASTFSMVTDIPFFEEVGADSLSAAERLKVIGTFLVAHELGHAVFKLPDFYDHPPQCLMTSRAEVGYVEGYRILEKHPGPCPKCQPWVEAKRYVFAAQAARIAHNDPLAIADYREAIRRTPRLVDGSYLSYIASLSLDIASLYVDEGDVDNARRWVRSVLRIMPYNRDALAWRAKLARKQP